MKKMLSVVLTFVAVSAVIAVLTYKFSTDNAHVQDEKIAPSQVAESSDTSVQSESSDASSSNEEVAFDLVDESGQPFTGESLKGKISVVNFVFRNCKTVCPFIMSKTRSIAPELQDYFGQVQFVSFTVDPTNDSQEVLQQWKKDVAVPGLSWVFVTGEKEEVAKTVKEDFKQTVMDNAANADMPIAHSSYLVLVDSNGQIAGYYDSNDNFKVKELTEKALTLASNLKKSGVGL